MRELAPYIKPSAGENTGLNLDTCARADYKGVAMKSYTTKEVAEKLGVHRVTLQEWIAKGWVPVPQLQTIGGGLVRLWSNADIERARKAIAKRGK